jgi:hypothetical protein
MGEWPIFLQFSAYSITLKRVPRIKNGVNVNSERRLTYKSGAIYRDRSENVTR